MTPYHPESLRRQPNRRALTLDAIDPMPDTLRSAEEYARHHHGDLAFKRPAELAAERTRLRLRLELDDDDPDGWLLDRWRRLEEAIRHAG